MFTDKRIKEYPIVIYWVFLPLFTVCCFCNVVFAEEISFSALTDGYWQIWKINPEGGPPRQLTRSQRDKKELTWFNNGHEFVYRSGNAEFYRFSLRTNQEYRMLRSYGNLFDPALSPSNKQLAFTRFRADGTDNSDIWITELSAQKIRRITSKPRLQYDPIWSGDGSKIAYVSSTGKAHHIYVADAEGEKAVCLTKKGPYNIYPAWSPDGSKIAFVSNRTGDYEIWVADKEGGRKQQLTHSKGLDTQPVWSIDGSKIIFVSNRQGNMQVWTMTSEGKEQRPLTPENMRCSNPQVIPQYAN